MRTTISGFAKFEKRNLGVIVLVQACRSCSLKFLSQAEIDVLIEVGDRKDIYEI
jgi:hypothetical protein